MRDTVKQRQRRRTEVAPAIAGGVILWYTCDSFPLTPLVYLLVLAHCIILMAGGHYTYALVPAGDWLRDAFDLSRNNYDKLGHFVQGFVPALIAREILVRKRVVASPRWRDFSSSAFAWRSVPSTN